MSIFKKMGAVFILPLAWISALLCRNKSKEVRYKKLQNWSRFIIKYLGCKLDVEGIENIPDEGPILFVSNHQGTLDPALIIAAVPRTMSFISKKKNEKRLVFGSWAITIDVIHFDQETREGNVYMLREAARRLKSGDSLLIFPEGTRSRGNSMNQFKAGAIQPAYLSKATIVPITLNNAYIINDKKNKNKNLKITFGEPKSYEDYKQYSYEEMSDILYSVIEKNIVYND
jgi:1-acyl-sn-glycerol-3-phosphate acyltransferase